MTDNELIKLFYLHIKNGLIARGLENVELIAFNQPTQQGTTNLPAVYFSKILDKLYGHVQRNTKYDLNILQMLHTESQFYETVFQFQALIPNTVNPDVLTASDVINTVLQIMQSNAFIEAIMLDNVNVLRISEVKNNYFVNDEGQHQPIPSFDVSFMHERKFVQSVPITERVEINVIEI